MKSFKTNSIIALSLLLFMLLGLSGCFLLPKYRDPKSIEIDGVEYVTGFYEDLGFIGADYRENDTCLFESEYHYWWRLENSTFDFYYCRNKESLWWHPSLYCKKSEFKQIKEYYQNIDNFDYYVGETYKNGESDRKIVTSADVETLEKIIYFGDNADYSFFNRKYERVKLNILDKDYKEPLIYRVSKDGLFVKNSANWIYWENKLYSLDYHDGSDYMTYAFPLDNELSSFAIEFLQSYGYIS